MLGSRLCLKLLPFILLLVPSSATLTGQELVDYINKNGLFKAEYDPSGYSRHFGLLKDPFLRLRTKTHTKDHYDLSVELPENFDSAEHWPQCAEVINIVRDQSNCGSCWAVSAASAISDRICIATNGTKKVSISSIAATSCAGVDGCQGGQMDTAYNEFILNGLPTGSEEPLHQGCQPYPFKRCAHHVNSTKYQPCSSLKEYVADTCSKECQKGYDKEYKADLYFGKKQFTLNDEEALQRELLKNGPVIVSFFVYESFLHYKSGVYNIVDGDTALGRHAVRVVGWGVEDGKKYWKIANSWNEEWGDNGYIKIIRGEEALEGIDSSGVAVIVAV